VPHAVGDVIWAVVQEELFIVLQNAVDIFRMNPALPPFEVGGRIVVLFSQKLEILVGEIDPSGDVIEVPNSVIGCVDRKIVAFVGFAGFLDGARKLVIYLF